MKNLLQAQNICFSYRNNIVLENISFELAQGESLGVIGPNGGGKTTLLKIIAGLIPDFQGNLSFSDGKKIKMAYLPQLDRQNTLFPLTCEEYVAQGGLYQYKKILTASEALKFIGLSHKRQILFRELSGGERQRAALAKALVSAPLLFLFDEPTKGLDSTGRDQLLGLVKKITKEFKRSVIIVDHNINQLLSYCDKILCLNKSLHWHDKKDVLTDNVLAHIYRCEFEHELIHEQKVFKEHSESSGHLAKKKVRT